MIVILQSLFYCVFLLLMILFCWQGGFMKRLSIIVPVYNSGEYLEECLTSLVLQDVFDFEVIIVDSNSSDNSLDIIKKYCELLPDVFKYIHLDENKGVSVARNIGFKYASGEYIGFVDSDDFIHRNMYGDMLALIDICKDLRVVSTGVQRVLEKDNSKSFIEREYGNISPKIIDVSKNPGFLCYESPSCCNKIYRRDLLEEEPFIPFVKWEDIAFVYPTILKASIIGFIPSKYYFYRINSKGIMDSCLNVNEDIFDIFKVCDSIVKKTIDNGTYNSSKEEIRKIQIISCLDRLKEIYNWDIDNAKKMEILNEFNKLIVSKYGTYTIDEASEELSFIKELDKPIGSLDVEDTKRKVLSSIREVKTF